MRIRRKFPAFVSDMIVLTTDLAVSSCSFHSCWALHDLTSRSTLENRLLPLVLLWVSWFLVCRPVGTVAQIVVRFIIRDDAAHGHICDT